MRLLLAVITLCCALAVSPASGAEEFPYKAYITADEVYVRSGPGQSYYPTDKLKAGQEVEVYRHDPGGWYAVRPPEGSFTWISGRFLKAGVDNLAVVTDDRVAGRVGSRFSNIRDIIQVRLHKAEVVEVLDKVEMGTGAQRKLWYKIAPPSGEFRWVFGKYVDPNYPHDGLRKGPAAESDEVQTDAVKQDPADPSPAETAAPEEAPSQPSPVQQSPAVALPKQTDSGAQPEFEPHRARELSSDAYRAELDKVDLELASMVVEEPTVWRFDEVQARAVELQTQAQTALERGQARVLLNKIARFEDIKQRYGQIGMVRQKNERSTRQFASLGRRYRVDNRTAEADGRFDGAGELTRVVSSKPGSPRYALVDDDGGVRYYVSPAPGVNLRHYVGRRVGVNGTRGYMPEQRAHHVMARHVKLLEGSRFR